MNGFTIYSEYFDLITLLPKDDQGELLLAICNYMFFDAEPDLNEVQMKVFRNLKRPLEKSKKRSLSGSTIKPNDDQTENKKGTNQNQSKIKATSNDDQDKTKMKSNQKQMKNKKETHQDVNVIGNDLEVNKGVVGGKGEKQKKRFEKPTVEEVMQYCAERKHTIAEKNKKLDEKHQKAIPNVDPQQFYNHYESNGWMVGKVPMQNWKAAVRTWEQNERTFQTQRTSPPAESVPDWLDQDLKNEEPSEEEAKEMEEILKEFSS